MYLKQLGKKMLDLTPKVTKSSLIGNIFISIKDFFSFLTVVYVFISVSLLFVIFQFLSLSYYHNTPQIISFLEIYIMPLQSISDFFLSYFSSSFILIMCIALFAVMLALVKFSQIKNHTYLSRLHTKENIRDYIEYLRYQLLQVNSIHEMERITDELSQSKLKLLALQTKNNFIKKAQKSIDKRNKKAVPNALKLIKNYDLQLDEEVLKYQATLHEWIHEWEKADMLYQKILKITPTYENYFEYAYFIEVYLEDAKKMDSLYNIALKHTDIPSDRAMILSYLGSFYAKDMNRYLEALEMYEEAKKIYKELANKNPKVYGKYYVNIILIGINLFGEEYGLLDEALKWLESDSNDINLLLKDKILQLKQSIE